ncbi:translation initiation factor 5A precursor (eIF-5A) [Methanothermus fervidus DSM 2088]|uniref:Translation initiation factor 5A n=1 Tax=Methanothermus fervidus (strain ATCC 43054 / DSM 2088 / JCM 10308 / V24 S) TaxID=523846 RepID=E3GWR8_METFV|nr:translation initiation factor IF-5A [Methanothermus fervidus]ADP77987.1 translation initiation factor 5A precursor (eIF-5A) [Methanothermus fervidus DSM 2088]
MAKKVVEVRTLKKGKYVVIDGEPSKIVGVTTSSPGKHGSAKMRIEAIGIFDGQKRSIVKPVDSKIEVPVINKKVGQVLAIMGDTVQLMDLETYDTFEVPIPEELKDKLTEGAEVEYLEAMGKTKLLRVK